MRNNDWNGNWFCSRLRSDFWSCQVTLIPPDKSRGDLLTIPRSFRIRREVRVTARKKTFSKFPDCFPIIFTVGHWGRGAVRPRWKLGSDWLTVRRYQQSNSTPSQAPPPTIHRHSRLTTGHKTGEFYWKSILWKLGSKLSYIVQLLLLPGSMSTLVVLCK